MKRRGFLNSLAKSAVIVALAPQLPLRTTPVLAWEGTTDGELLFCWTIGPTAAFLEKTGGHHLVRLVFQNGKIEEYFLT